jgi:hypothetical protein
MTINVWESKTIVTDFTSTISRDKLFLRVLKMI